MTFRWWVRRIALAPASILIGGTILTLGCNRPDDGPSPPPNHVGAIGAACNACTPSEAVHPCPPRTVGSVQCQGIPVANAGDSMLICGIGVSGQGVIGALQWRSSDALVAAVTPAGLTVTHCTNEITNARLDAKSPGTATITLEEFSGTTVVSSRSAAVVVKAPE